jgi:tetratricopeptide (TPR) repeat protein
MDLSQNFIAQWIDCVINAALRNKKQVLLGFVLVALLVAGFFGHSWYAKQQAISAHRTLVEAMKVLEAPIKKSSSKKNSDEISFATSDEKWTKVEEVFAQGYSQYKYTGLAPMFLVYQSQASINLGKHDEAISLLKDAIALMKNTDIQDYFRVKLALLSIDSERDDLKQKGLQDLRALAENISSAAQEFALYEIGLYFWDEKDFGQARSYWQQLLVKFAGRNARSGSSFVPLVKQKLSLITVEN